MKRPAQHFTGKTEDIPTLAGRTSVLTRACTPYNCKECMHLFFLATWKAAAARTATTSAKKQL